VFPDETFQYLEPAHRLVFGSGVVTWEYLEGIRSWFLPGIVAGLMWLTSLVSPEPGAYLMVVRLLCVLASLAIPFVGYQLTVRRLGPAAAVLVGLLCAAWSDVVYYAPTMLTEPLATDAALLAIWYGDGVAGQPISRGRALAAGLLFGLAASLRWQYAPILGLAALVQHARQPRTLAWVTAAAALVVVLILGGLDAITWGAPFQSVWLNFARNAGQGVSAAMGTSPWSLYIAYNAVAWGLPFGPFIFRGATRIPVLAVVVLATILLHTLIPHKELRFIFLATACIPIGIGFGAALLLDLDRRARPVRLSMAIACVAALTIAGITAAVTYSFVTPPDAWHRYRSMHEAQAEARTVPGVCGLWLRDARMYTTGGYTYFHRNAPIYFEDWAESEQTNDPALRLPFESIIDGRVVPQYPHGVLAAHPGRFNVIISEQPVSLPGFAQRRCFGAGRVDDRTFCVYARPGGCD
jgi:hypothetical protein